MYLTIRKRTVLVVFACLFALCLIPTGVSKLASTPETVSASATDWGLSFGKDGQAPVANASREHLEQFDAYYMGNPDEKKIYLTFDAGYENGYTEQILDVLKQHKVPAAFFLVGNYLETAPDLVKRMVEEGHIVGNHTYSHPDMSKIADARAFEQEIEKLEQGYRTVTGCELPRFYRPPQGKFSEENLKCAKDLGYKTVFWSLAYVDWYNDKQPTREEAMEKLTSRIHPGAIVLLHSTSKTNAEILDELLTEWREMGYAFASLDELTKKG
ncbi:MAG: delta-lactam-biosynthetic de-N-acetylase [Ruminococcaceae bacterium]|nr:delta-lactam-biosynthetic de-N-acetylase [Oscillospiraceae bacterium]